MAGWIKLWEIPEDHWLRSDLRYIGAWNELLRMAEPKDRKIVRYGSMVDAKRGNVYTSLHELAEKWHVTRRFVRHFLEMLVQDGMVSVLQADHQGYHLKVNNYAKYQDKPDHKRTTYGTTKDTTEDTTKDTTFASSYLTNTEGIEGTEGESGTFVPPTIKDVVAYISDRHLKVDGRRFYEYYEARGWKGIRNWKALARSWEARDGTKPKAKTFDNFEGRESGSAMDEYIKQLEGET